MMPKHISKTMSAIEQSAPRFEPPSGFIFTVFHSALRDQFLLSRERSISGHAGDSRELDGIASIDEESLAIVSDGT